MPRNKHRWVVRTVKQGKVRIYGVDYKVSEQHTAYDGRLDGLRFLFARYWEGDNLLPTVFLWGLESEAKSGVFEAEPPYQVDGYLPWGWWHSAAYQQLG